MAENEQILSFDDLCADADFDFVIVKTKRGLVKLGTLSSLDTIEWFANENQEYGGLYMLARAMVMPDGTRIGQGLPEPERKQAIDLAVDRLKRRDTDENAKLIEAALILNKIRKPKAVPKNEDGGAEPTSASPSDSPAT